MVSLLIVSLLSMIDKFYLRQFVSLEDLGLYMTALKIVAAIGLIKPFVGIFWTPVSMKWYEKGREARQLPHTFYWTNLFCKLILHVCTIFSSLNNAIIQ